MPDELRYHHACILQNMLGAYLYPVVTVLQWEWLGMIAGGLDYEELKCNTWVAWLTCTSNILAS